jgi:hypothetical protein
MKRRKHRWFVRRDCLLKTRSAFLLCFFLLLAAPSLGALDFSYGLKGELLFCGFSGGHPELAGYTGLDSNGFALGSYARFSYKDILSVQPELLFALKGDKFKNSNTGERIGLTQLYIEIPVLLGVSFPLPISLHIAPKIFGGPYFGIHLFSTGKASEFELGIKPFDVGVVTGYGIEVGRLFFEISHNIGLVPIAGNLHYDTHFISVGFRTQGKKNMRY